jgi:myo-inositol-1(or 4)-monophosphatase
MQPRDRLARPNARRIFASQFLGDFAQDRVIVGRAVQYKTGHDPVTEVDRAVDAALRESLRQESEGWLSEESADDLSRLSREHVWVVDPLDGTREFVAGIPEFCVSIAFVENGRPVAGGVYNPATREEFLGAIDFGVLYNGRPAFASQRTTLIDALILASRSEVNRGEWNEFNNGECRIQPVGSVAYKLGLVAAGRADVTFTLVPKNEWDVAAGAALVESAGGFVSLLDGSRFTANRPRPLLPGFIASGPLLREPLFTLLNAHITAAQQGRRC